MFKYTQVQIFPNGLIHIRYSNLDITDYINKDIKEWLINNTMEKIDINSLEIIWYTWENYSLYYIPYSIFVSQSFSFEFIWK